MPNTEKHICYRYCREGRRDESGRKLRLNTDNGTSKAKFNEERTQQITKRRRDGAREKTGREWEANKIKKSSERHDRGE